MQARAQKQIKCIGARTRGSVIAALAMSLLLNGNLALLEARAEAAKPTLKPLDPSLAKLDTSQKSADLGTVKSSPVTTKGSKGGLVPPPPPTAYSYNPYGYPPPYPAYPPAYPMPGYPMPPGYAMPGYAMPGYAMPHGYAMPPPYGAPGYAPGMMPMQQPMQQPMQVNVQPGMPPQQMQQPMQNMQMQGGMGMQGGMQQMPQQGYGNSGYQGTGGRAGFGGAVPQNYGGGQNNFMAGPSNPQGNFSSGPTNMGGNFGQNQGGGSFGGGYQSQQMMQKPGYGGNFSGQPSPPAQASANFNSSGFGTTGAQGQAFPSENLIPQFGKPLPLDASNKGPAQGWTSNPGGAAGNTAVQSTMGDGGPMNDETRVARLEKIAFGSTYPEHEVEDRLDHLEKEIFGDKSTGDLNTRIMRLESKLGGKGAFGGNTRGSADVPNGNYRQPNQSPVALAATPQSFSSVAPQGNGGARGSAATSSGDAAGDQINSSGEAPLTAKALDMASVLGFSPNSSTSPIGSDGAPTTQNPQQTGSSQAEGSSSSQATDTSTTANTAKGANSETTSPTASADESNLAAMLTPALRPAIKGPQATLAGSAVPSTNENDLASLISTADSPARAVARAMPYDKESGDYLDLVKTWDDDKRARFNRFPIRVRLPEDSPEPWRKSMISGVERWGKYIPLAQAKKTESADIEVSWVNHLVPNVLGVTRLTASAGNINVRVFMLRPTHYLPVVPQKALSGAFLHEMGHALGIFGHSKDKDDLMFAFEIGPRNKLTQDEDGSISNRDVNTLKRIYEGKALPRSFNLDKPLEWSLCANAS